MIEGLKTPPLLLALLLSALAHAFFVGGWWLGAPSSTLPVSEPITIRLIEPAVPAPKPIAPPIQSRAQPQVTKPTSTTKPSPPTAATPASTPVATVQPTPVLTSTAPPLAATPTVPAAPALQVPQVSQIPQPTSSPVIETPRSAVSAPAVIAPVAPVPKPASRSDMAIVCPTQIKPIMPARAVAEGISGVVKAQVLIKDGAVKEVTIVSGPQVYRNAVRSALLQYKCITAGNEVIAEQSFDFKVE